MDARRCYQLAGGLDHARGLVVEYSPATGETRVRFPAGVEEFFLQLVIFVPGFISSYLA